MNSATKNLENDHVQILRLLDIMEEMTDNANPEVSDLETVVSLIRNFADGFHHAKEEDILFPALALKGLSPYHGPVAVMLSEHTEGRNFVAGIARNIELYKNGDKGALEDVYKNMKGYIDLLRNHIAKENNILFRMADNLLSETDHKELLQRYSSVKSVTGSNNDPGKYISEIDRLEKAYIA